jgi:uncharacterized protein (DUF3084 family)
MSDWKSKLKGIFVESDPNAPKTEPAPVVNQQPKTPTPTPVYRPAPPVNTTAGTTQAGRFKQMLIDQMHAANRPGFDYLEFRASLDSLASMGMDEATRYKSAMAMAATMQASPEVLVQTAQEYLAILRTESQKFEAAAQKNLGEQVNTRSQQMEQLQSNIQQRQQQLQELTRQIEQEQQSLQQLRNDAGTAQQKIQETIQAFGNDYSLLTNEIQLHIENIKKHRS